MIRIVRVAGGLAVAACLGVGLAASGEEAPLAPPSYTAAQAQRGEAVYVAQCSSCHGDNLDDGQFAAPLKGSAFKQHWGGKGLDGPFGVMTTQMPPTDPGSLGAATYADVLAFLLSRNGVAPGTTELPADAAVLKGLAAPK